MPAYPSIPIDYRGDFYELVFIDDEVRIFEYARGLSMQAIERKFDELPTDLRERITNICHARLSNKAQRRLNNSPEQLPHVDLNEEDSSDW